MALADRVLQLKLVADVSDINKGLNKAEGRLKGFGKRAGSFLKIGGLFAATQGIEMVTDALSDAWDGWREGEKVAAQLQNTYKRLGRPARQASRAIDRISASTKRLGTSDDEAIAAYQKLLIQTDSERESMKRLRIAQDLVASGSAPNLTAAIKIITAASDGSAKVVAKFGLDSKTAAGRVDELAASVKGAAKTKAELDPLGVFFNALAEDLESIVGSAASGDIEGMLAGLRAIVTDLGAFITKIAPGLLNLWRNITGGAFDDMLGKLRNLADAILPRVEDALGAVGAVAAALQPIIQNIVMPALRALVSILAPGVKGALAMTLETVRGVLNGVAALLRGDFAGALDIARRTVQRVADIISQAFEGVVGAIRRLIPGIARATAALALDLVSGFLNTVDNIVSGVRGILGDVVEVLTDWLPRLASKALKIGKALFHGLWDVLTGLPLLVAQLIRAALNALIRVFNDFEIPGFKIGDFQVWPKIELPNIPLLASGGIVTRPTLAGLGESGPEAVIPLRRGGLGNSITVNVEAGIGDPIAIGREVERVLQAYRFRTGVI